MNTLAVNQKLWDAIRATLHQYKTILFPYLLLMVRELEWLGDTDKDTLKGVKKRSQLVKSIFSVIENTPEEQRAAVTINKILGHHRLDTALAQRADLITDQILPHIPPTACVLSFGCGDGRVDWAIRTHVTTVQLYDVADYRLPHITLPFTAERNRLDHQHFDVATIIAVWHHCIDYQSEIAWIANHADRLVVIESVLDEYMPWAVQAVIDWLYNRGMHPGANIPVPGHFHTVQEWTNILAQHGFSLVAEEDYGIDIPLVPEHHVLIVFEPQK